MANGHSPTFPFNVRHAFLRDGPVAFFDEGAGPAVVFVHGLVGDFTHFEHVAPPLTAHHRVVGLDLPGCGMSGKPAVRHTVGAYARTLLDLMDHLGIRRATLVGHSAGGQVVAQAALLAPDRIERLVLLNAAGMCHYAWPLHLAARVLFRRRLLQLTLERLARPILGFVFVARNRYTEKFTRDSLDRPVHPTLEEMAKVFEDLVPDLMQPTLHDEAHRLRMPVLVLWGAADRLAPLSRVRSVAARLPQGTLRVLAGCGHLPMIEDPPGVLAAISHFLGDDVAAPAAA